MEGIMRKTVGILLFVLMLAVAGGAQSQGREVRIVTFGDSGPAGDGVRTSEAYPAVLQATLRARGINATVQNISTSGFKTSQGLERVDTIPAGTHIVITEFGSNDLRGNVRTADMNATMDAIVKKLRARNIEVIVMATRGIDYSAVASANGATFVPYPPSYRAYLQSTGKHLTPEGHRKAVEELIVPAIMPLLAKIKS
jgi:acyl-CoA thioesterase I